MPCTALSEKEVGDLIANILDIGARNKVEALLSAGILNARYRSDPRNPYWGRQYSFLDYEMSVHYFEAEGASVSACDLQFKRPSSFLSVFVNRNARLFSILGRAARSHYGEWGESSESRDSHAKIKQCHFRMPEASKPLVGSRSSFESLGSECAIYDETRGDSGSEFVVFRFKRMPV